MRDIIGTVLCSMALMLILLLFGKVILDTQPQAHASQLKNAYYPYSVETSVKDK